MIPAPSVLPVGPDAAGTTPARLPSYFAKHQWLILTFLLTVVTVVTIASFKMKPIYEAAARVEVDKESSQNTLPFQDENAYDEYIDMDSYLETQTKIFRVKRLPFRQSSRWIWRDIPSSEAGRMRWRPDREAPDRGGPAILECISRWPEREARAEQLA